MGEPGEGTQLAVKLLISRPALEPSSHRVKPFRYSLRNLRYLEGVRQPISKEINLVSWKDLGFALQSAKAGGVPSTVVDKRSDTLNRSVTAADVNSGYRTGIYAMSTDAISAISGDLARVAAADAQLSAAHAEESAPPGSAPGEVERGHAAVEAADAALAQAQAAVSADLASQGAQTSSDPQQATPAAPSNHYVDTVA